jgi:hypothetical protein
VTHYEEISKTIERKIKALCAHREMMRNTIHQYQLQLKTWGRQIAWLQESREGDLQPLLAMFLLEQAKALAIEAGWNGETQLAEAFRMERFGDLEPLFQRMAEPLPSAEPAPARAERSRLMEKTHDS